MKGLVRFLASGFFTGYVPRGSGTVASLLASCLWIVLSKTRWYPVFPLVFTILGFCITGYAERVLFGEPDSSRITIDEIAGMLVTYASFSFTFDLEGVVYGIGGFVLFRLFDIWKPYPIRRIQYVKGSAGIMLDDLASAAAANGLLQLIRLLLFS
jgi:phosphatidylglycerophosphatase A